MRSKAELGKELLDALSGISALLEQGRAVALDEQEALVANDAELLVKACKAQEEIMRRISDTDQRAADIGARLAIAEGLDPETADASAIAEAAGGLYGESIKREIARVRRLAAVLHEEHETNRVLLQNGLEIVACCLRTVAADRGPNSYSSDAGLTQTPPLVLSVDIRA